MQYIEYRAENEIGILTINRPKALNALNSEVVVELTEFIRELTFSSIRCLIITGAGEKAFVAGADINAMKDMDKNGGEALSIAGNTLMELIEQFPAPVIAAVNGFALGGGCELAVSCDIRIAAENASFSLPEVGLGIIPGYGGIQRLTRLLGPAKAKELAFTADRIKAPEALAIGLVNKVTPAAELMAEAMKMARKIAANAPFAVRAAKRVANDSIGLTLAQATRLEAKALGECFGTADQKEGMAAFAEKREHAPYTGK